MNFAQISSKSKNKFHSCVRWLALSGFFVLLSGSGWLFYSRNFMKSKDGVAVSFIAVEKGDVEIAINEGGALELGDQQDIKSPGEVAVERVLVKIGDRVTLGQQLLLLRNLQGQKNLGDQDLQLQIKEVALSRSREKILEAQDKLREAQQELREPLKEFEVEKQRSALARSREKFIEAQLKLATAQKQLREASKEQELEIRKQQINIARNREKVIEAKAKLAVELQKLKNTEVLAAKGFIPSDELQQLQESVRSAESSIKDAELEASIQNLELQRITTEQKRTVEQQNNLLAAQSELKEAQSTVKNEIRELQRLTLEKQRSTEQKDKVLTAQSELRQAQSDVSTQIRELQVQKVERETILAQIKNNVVSAPITGKILDLKVKDGEGVKAGDVLLTIGNPGQELVRLQLGTLDAAKVKVNQQARIKVIGPNSKEFAGRLKSIHPQAVSDEGGGGGGMRMSGGSGGSRVPATIELDKPSGSLIPGSQVSVEIIVQQRKDVVALNLEAIQRTEPQPFVWIKDAQGKAQKRNITLGLEGPTQVEIKSGLTAGDKVILPTPDTSLKVGTPVIEAAPDANIPLPTPSVP
jgi:HlyD family secretion protein